LNGTFGKIGNLLLYRLTVWSLSFFVKVMGIAFLVQGAYLIDSSLAKLESFMAVQMSWGKWAAI